MKCGTKGCENQARRGFNTGMCNDCYDACRKTSDSLLTSWEPNPSPLPPSQLDRVEQKLDRLLNPPAIHDPEDLQQMCDSIYITGG